MRILVAYDGFEQSRPALEEAVRIALTVSPGIEGVRAPTEVIVLSVVPPPEQMPNPGGVAGMRPHAVDDVAEAHRFLKERGIESEMKITHGKPADEILREATERKCDRIVMGTRGLGKMGRLLQGSVSTKVTKNAPCTVVIATAGKMERIEPSG